MNARKHPVAAKSGLRLKAMPFVDHTAPFGRTLGNTRAALSIVVIASLVMPSCAGNSLGVPQRADSSHRPPGDGYVRFSAQMVAYPASQPELRSLAEKIQSTLGKPGRPSAIPTNPVCCFWIEINPWRPSPGVDGFVLVTQHGGSLLWLSSIDQAENVLRILEQSVRREGGDVYLPAGLTSNYPRWKE